MKNGIKKSLVLVLMFSAMVAYSNMNTNLPKKKANNVTVVTIEYVNKGSTLFIKDSVGFILYSQKIKESGVYTKRFDFSNLPNADYYFELDKADEIKIMPFTVRANIAEFVKAKEYVIDKPDVAVKDDRVYISLLSTEKQLWEIDVYYEGDDLAFSEKLNNVQRLNRIYDFSTSKKGNYTLVFSMEGRTFENSIEIPYRSNEQLNLK